jgi:hypothetical protein
MLQSVMEKGDDIIMVAKSQKTLGRLLGLLEHANLERLEQLQGLANVKCLISEIYDSSLAILAFQFRTIPNYPIGLTSYFVYGDSYAMIIPDGSDSFSYVAIKSISVSLDYRDEFLSLWNAAHPPSIQAAPQSRRTKT